MCNLGLVLKVVLTLSSEVVNRLLYIEHLTKQKQDGIRLIGTSIAQQQTITMEERIDCRGAYPCRGSTRHQNMDSSPSPDVKHRQE